MSANELRKAAATERAHWGGEQNARNWPHSSAIHLALADWLDSEAELGTYRGQHHPAALAVASLINGGAA